MSGFFLVRRRSVDNIEFQPTGFKLLLEVLLRGQIRSMEEVPFAFGLRYKGASKANFKVGLEYARLLVRLYAVKMGLGR
jgi:dolichol-phosphate mannosyltransferase